VRCIEENTVFDFVRGALDGESRESVARHTDECEPCRRLVAAAADALARTDAQAERAAPLRSSGVSGGLLGGKYEVARLLGAGAMGTVYEAVHTLTRRRVAIKLLHAHLSTDPSTIERFIREAQSASRISHPNVVGILDMGQDAESGAYFMVQEFLTGVTLRQRLRERGRLSVDEAIEIIEPAVSALVAAHERGIVHRDIKPENIFLAVDAQGKEVTKLIDFGLSKLISEHDRLAITGSGHLLGTPYYMAPEQLRGQTDVDARADVWAFGVVLFELVAGRRPFVGPTYPDLSRQVLRQRAPRLAEIEPAAGAALSTLVDRALASSRDRRLHARALHQGLRQCRAVASSSAAAHSGKTSSGAVGGPRRRARIGWFAGALVVCASALVAAALGRHRRTGAAKEVAGASVTVAPTPMSWDASVAGVQRAPFVPPPSPSSPRPRPPARATRAATKTPPPAVAPAAKPAVRATELPEQVPLGANRAPILE
jgi:serine/threonine-protein kinase